MRGWLQDEQERSQPPTKAEKLAESLAETLAGIPEPVPARVPPKRGAKRPPPAVSMDPVKTSPLASVVNSASSRKLSVLCSVSNPSSTAVSVAKASAAGGAFLPMSVNAGAPMHALAAVSDEELIAAGTLMQIASVAHIQAANEIARAAKAFPLSKKMNEAEVRRGRKARAR